MIRASVFACVCLGLTAPAAAQDLQDLVAAFRAGEAVDGARLAELADAAAAETGVIATGLFEGDLMPTPVPLALTAVTQVRIECITNVVSEIPLPAFPPEYRELSQLTRNAENDGNIVYETTDPISVLRMGADWDASGLSLREIYMDDEFGEIRLRPTEDGGLQDIGTGDAFPPGSEEANMVGGLFDAIADVNPWWFLVETQVQVGDAWLVPGREGDLSDALRAMVTSSLGMPGATLDENIVFTAVTGVTERDGAQILVFETMLDVDLQAPGLGEINLRIAGVELYDVATFTRVGMDNEMRVAAPGFGFEMTQDQACSARPQ